MLIPFCLLIIPFCLFVRVYLGLKVLQVPKERKENQPSVQDQGSQGSRVILALRGSLERQEYQARMDYQVY